MPNYEKMYHLMFNSITDALKNMEHCDYDHARLILEKAQMAAEEIYISSDNGQDGQDGATFTIIK